MNNGDLVAAVIERTERAANVLKLYGAETLNMAEGWASPLKAAESGARAAKGSVGDPTGERAVNAPDGTEAVYAELKADLDALEVLAARVTHAVIRYRRLSPTEAAAIFEPLRGRQTSLTPCACVHCDDAAELGERYCGPCGSYLASRPSATQVPRRVIEQRKWRRAALERRRRYATGPLAEAE